MPSGFSGIAKKIAFLIAFVGGAAGLFANYKVLVSDPNSFACAVGLPLSWCAAPPPIEKWSNEVGGSGGGLFSQITCAANQAIVGLYGKKGGDNFPIIYSVGPICATAQFDRTHALKSRSEKNVKGDQVGSDEGDAFELMCPQNMVVVGSEFASSPISTNHGVFVYLIAPLKLRCSDALRASDPSSVKSVLGDGRLGARASRQPFSCPDGSAAFGIGGKAGQFVDALSLGCRSH